MKRIAAVLAATILALLGVLALAPTASAVDVPGVEVCPKKPPFPAMPTDGVAGMFASRPDTITNDETPQHIWTTGGLAGMHAHTYDLGCAVDPTSWTRIANANTGSGVSNFFLSAGDTLVAVTDAVDRRAWQPGWILTPLDSTAASLSIAIQERYLPLALLAGLLAASGILLWRASKADLKETTNSLGWIIVVLTITSTLIIVPLMLAQQGQRVSGAAVALLNNGSDSADAQTNRVVENVQYQGFLRRNFGNSESATAKTLGPALLSSTRLTWAEVDRIAAAPADEQGELREKITEAKAAKFSAVATKVKEADPGAYRHLTGEMGGQGVSLIEFLFIVSSCFFRLAAAMLMVAATIALVVLAFCWVFATPATVLPTIGSHSGKDMGMGMINNAVATIKYVLLAALGSWCFGIYSQAAMAPGIPLLWSLILLVIGTLVGFFVLRPDRKLLAILSLGHIKDHGGVGASVRTALAAYFGTQVAAWRNRPEKEKEPERASEAADVPPIPEARTVHATIFNPAPAFVPERATTVDGEPLEGKIIHALPGGVYERGPAPPPDTASTTYEAYERTDDNEGAHL